VFAEAFRTSTDASNVIINTEDKAADEGADATTPAPAGTSVWLGATATCWQFKAGSAGAPSRIENEVKKNAPAATLRSGGRFVVVCSGSNSGDAGRRKRLDALHKGARAKRIPISRIEVLTSESLATWCNSVPAVASRWSGLPNTVWRLDQWAQLHEHKHPWKPAAGQQEKAIALSKEIDPVTGSVQHFHLYGPPGVGKTRFVLELCKAAAWAPLVVYVHQAEDVGLMGILDGVASHLSAMLVVVADEVQSSKLSTLRNSVEKAGGRLRLITIGHSPSPDIARIPSEELKRMDVFSMTPRRPPVPPTRHAGSARGRPARSRSGTPTSFRASSSRARSGTRRSARSRACPSAGRASASCCPTRVPGFLTARARPTCSKRTSRRSPPLPRSSTTWLSPGCPGTDADVPTRRTRLDRVEHSRT
jgi:hypothetical protein